nr:phosphotransferase family protein [Propionibacteriales bacterium]
MADYSSLVRPDLLGPRLAEALGDDRWRHPSIKLITGGKSNLTFELTSGAGTVIVRRPPSGELLPRAHDMGREARIQRALAPTPVPVAAILLDDSAGQITGTPMYVMESVPGHVIRDALPTGYATTVADKHAIAHALVDVLADLHAVDPVAVGLGDYGRSQGFLSRQVDRWTQQWESSKSHDVAAVDGLAQRLA